MTAQDSAADAAAARGAAVGSWTLDPAGTEVVFDTKSMWGMVKVHGAFTAASGTGTVAPDGTVTGSLVLDAASIDTKQKKRDEHLRSKDFFDVTQHPTFTFTVDGITPQDGDRVQVAGSLTVRGRTEALTVPARVTEASADAVTLRTEFDFDRSRVGITWGPLKMATMIVKVGATVRLRRTAE